MGRFARTVGRLLGTVGVLALAVSFVSTGSHAVAAPGDAHLAGLKYVALGDSNAAAFGLVPLSSFPLMGCAQAAANYPHQVATELGLALTDVSCSGATGLNLTTTPQVVSDGTAPLQNASLSATTDIVTLSIGANDLGFTDIMTFCSALTATGPVVGDAAAPLSLANCKAAFVQPGPIGDTLASKINGAVAASLDAVLNDIAARAPNAKVFVVGYMALTPAAPPAGPDGCFTSALGAGAPPFPVNSYPYTVIDVPYLHSVEALLNQAVSAAATSHGATMVSLFDASVPHSACDLTDPYSNGVSVTSFSLSPLSVTLLPGALHPNAVGVSFQTTQVEAAIRSAFPAPTDPTGPAAASPGSVLAVSGFAQDHGLTIIGALLLFAGCVSFGVGRKASRRQS